MSFDRLTNTNDDRVMTQSTQRSFEFRPRASRSRRDPWCTGGGMTSERVYSFDVRVTSVTSIWTSQMTVDGHALFSCSSVSAEQSSPRAHR